MTGGLRLRRADCRPLPLTVIPGRGRRAVSSRGRRHGISRHVRLPHNLIAAVLVHALAEVSVLGESVGVHRSDLLEFLCAGAVGSPFIEYKARLMRSLDFTAVSTADLMLNDVNLGHALAAEGHVKIPLVEHTRAA